MAKYRCARVSFVPKSNLVRWSNQVISMNDQQHYQNNTNRQIAKGNQHFLYNSSLFVNNIQSPSNNPLGSSRNVRWGWGRDSTSIATSEGSRQFENSDDEDADDNCKRKSLMAWLICGGLLLTVLTLGAMIMSIYLIIMVETSTTTTKTSTTTTTKTSTTTTTTATVPPICLSTCVNTTTSTASWMAFYSFDSVLTDGTGTYPLTGSYSGFVPGWVGSAISFVASSSQRVSTSNLPLSSRSFTIEFWFYTLSVASSVDIPFMGQYTSHTTDHVLFLTIYQTHFYFGFYGDDLMDSSTIATNTWYHVAFVFDITTLYRAIYVNGQFDTSRTGSGVLQSTVGAFTIGGATIGGRVTSGTAYYTGYIDHVTVSGRVKSACEIYLDANLACYFTFDSASSLTDSGPNFLAATNTGATSVTGRVNQALQISSSPSYIAVNGITALKSGYSSTFSISMWVIATSVSGGATLIHASTQSNGQGACLAMWGLTATGVVTVNVINANNNTISATASSALPLNMWTHIAQTFSTTNGIRLYINGYLIASTSASTGRSIGPYTFIGASPSGTSYCNAGSIGTGQFYGSVDEYRVFHCELTAADVCRLANPT